MDWSKGSSQIGFVKPDLTPCDFFQQGHIKSKVYATNSLILPELEEIIPTVCSKIEEEILHNLDVACVERWLKIAKSGGVQLDSKTSVIFKT